MALELENNKKYEEAFVAYKTAIDILINYGKGIFYLSNAILFDCRCTKNFSNKLLK